jgi:protein phosphatase
VRNGQITQMTSDPSLDNDYLLAMPELTEEQRSELPKNVITRALGMQEQVTVDLQSDDVQTGDYYVLCSDGLSGMIDDAEIAQVVQTSGDLEEICRRLVALANEHGGEDNITALVVRIDADNAEAQRVADTLPAVGAASAAAAVAGRPDATADTPPAGNTAPKSDK